MDTSRLKMMRHRLQRIPVSGNCVCGQKFEPTDDQETCCSKECSLEEALRALEGRRVHVEENMLKQMEAEEKAPKNFMKTLKVSKSLTSIRKKFRKLPDLPVHHCPPTMPNKSAYDNQSADEFVCVEQGPPISASGPYVSAPQFPPAASSDPMGRRKLPEPWVSPQSQVSKVPSHCAGSTVGPPIRDAKIRPLPVPPTSGENSSRLLPIGPRYPPVSSTSPQVQPRHQLSREQVEAYTYPRRPLNPMAQDLYPHCNPQPPAVRTLPTPGLAPRQPLQGLGREWGTDSAGTPYRQDGVLDVRRARTPTNIPEDVDQHLLASSSLDDWNERSLSDDEARAGWTRT